ncbi:aspartate dehydrogenase [uncultured Roseobacter sp.]|uniref:aspartate dehydrogenase n=1 Tax=uncultured Roseobacter sp. TaxID=114847 RepID=UPI002636288F|nr:aspartate dehydrogenase [uncultured Roseobacter sp.]
MMISVGLIGYGAIGAEILDQLNGDSALRIADVLVRPERVTEMPAPPDSHTRLITHPDGFSSDIGFVLECAGHQALAEIGPDVIRKGISLGVLSAGALADRTVLQELKDAAKEGGSQISVLPGAIGGIDALAAAAAAGLTEVIYTGRKPPQAWRGTPAEDTCDLTEIKEATTVFDGSAGDAARLFPKNANVVATVALAGVGFENTQVTLIADPGATGNSHRIQARGPLTSLDFTTAGAPLPSNPKTSALTAMSAVRALRNQAGLICI